MQNQQYKRYLMQNNNSNKIIKDLIKILGLPATMIRSDAEVQQIAEEKAEAQQQQAQMQQEMAQSEMARNAAPAIQAVTNAETAEREQQQ